jgi:hypothetical protein
MSQNASQPSRHPDAKAQANIENLRKSLGLGLVSVEHADQNCEV